MCLHDSPKDEYLKHNSNDQKLQYQCLADLSTTGLQSPIYKFSFRQVKCFGAK